LRNKVNFGQKGNHSCGSTKPSPQGKMMQRYIWSKLNNQQVGKFAEYFVKMELAMYEFQIFGKLTVLKMESTIPQLLRQQGSYSNIKQKEEKMFRVILCLVSFLLPMAFISGCMSASQHQQALHSSREREMTVGIVQKEIRVGMSQADVAMALGSPNIVTRDSDARETWIYDKIASEASYSGSSSSIGGGGGAGGIAGNTLILGLISGGYSQQSGAYSKTQKTLTVVIKYDKNNTVDTFSYHASKF
jgi:outer membrane protein assembly factor BamE (lipoprotein component of BamABCDE complex)